jgi:hypothetical protein
MTTESYATYCIIDSDREIPDGIVGLYARPAWNVPYRGIGVVTSTLTAPVRDVVAGAVEHETVVERLMQTYTVLPMRFPTAFGSREAVLAMMEQHYGDFRENLHRLRDQVEFGVRVIWPDAMLRTDEGGAAATCGSERPAPHHVESSGKLYMQERFRRHKCRNALRDQAAQFGRRLDAALSEFATAKRLRSPTTDSFAFDGVYLVRKDKGVDFRHAFADAKSSEPGLRYLLSGPWPPYNFITAPAGLRRTDI